MTIVSLQTLQVIWNCCVSFPLSSLSLLLLLFFSSPFFFPSLPLSFLPVPLIFFFHHLIHPSLFYSLSVSLSFSSLPSLLFLPPPVCRPPGESYFWDLPSPRVGSAHRESTLPLQDDWQKNVSCMPHFLLTPSPLSFFLTLFSSILFVACEWKLTKCPHGSVLIKCPGDITIVNMLSCHMTQKMLSNNLSFPCFLRSSLPLSHPSLLPPLPSFLPSALSPSLILFLSSGGSQWLLFGSSRSFQTMSFAELRRKIFPGRDSMTSDTMRLESWSACLRWERPFTNTSISYQNLSWLFTSSLLPGEVKGQGSRVKGQGS